MNNNLKFTDMETELFYNMISEVIELNFQNNSEISFKHLFKLWDTFHRKLYMEKSTSNIKPFIFLINHKNRE